MERGVDKYINAYKGSLVARLVYAFEMAQDQTADTVPHERIILPKELQIVWSSDDRYWRMPPKDEPHQPAELLQVMWLEVTGSVNNVDPSKTYEIGFSVSMTPDAFGWKDCPVHVVTKFGRRGNYVRRKTNLSLVHPAGKEIEIPGTLLIGKNQAPANSTRETLYFGMYEVWSGKWKGGLKIHHAYVRERN
ncbi:hypothetical protein RJ639_029919 [Escallonia herrerae]|uniref:Protein PHLOEM PROTEIN 2-LIKE A9-like n=1 Tax=Escallonia herrerae TaxID=1293975 RepID=A0AA88WZD1_9ASTE|nr:hypothetical protein RJ639_029919 [Escallonia herrerae]